MIFLSRPRRGPLIHDLNNEAANHASSKVRYTAKPWSSVTEWTFNCALAAALDSKARWLAILHDDVWADIGWADSLIEVAQDFGATMVAAVIPLKLKPSRCSTALETDDPWHPVNLTLEQVLQRYKIWTDPKLLLNTGCCVIDLNNIDDSIIFTNESTIIKTPQGRRAITISEDWIFSRKIRERGLSLYCHSGIPTIHLDGFEGHAWNYKLAPPSQ